MGNIPYAPETMVRVLILALTTAATLISSFLTRSCADLSLTLWSSLWSALKILERDLITHFCWVSRRLHAWLYIRRIRLCQLAS